MERMIAEMSQWKAQKCTGKNLFDETDWYNVFHKQSTTSCRKTIYDNAPCCFVKPDGISAIRYMENRFEENTVYTVSYRAFGIIGTGSSTGIMFRYTDGSQSGSYVPADGKWHNMTVVSRSGKTIGHIRFGYNYGQGIYIAKNSIQLELGSTATEYEPYCGGATDAFTADDCKGGYFSVLPDYGLKVEGKTQQDGTPSPDNPVPIRCVKAGTKIHIRGKYSVGSTISTTWENRALNFDIVDFNKGTLANGGSQKFANLLLHDILSYGTIPFSASQLLYYTEHGLPAGTYKFTFDHAAYGSGTQYDGTYMFTLTQPIPAGGGFRHTNIGGWKSSYAKSDVIGNYLVTYNPVSTGGVAIETVAVAEYDGSIAVDLGVFTARSRSYYTEDDTANNGKRDFTERNAYGTSRYRDSAIRQYLNSAAEAVAPSDTTTISKWWNPQTVFDRIPNGAKLAGFLNGLDPVFVAALGEVEVKTALCDSDRVDGATYDITIDKVWLPSMTDVFGGTNNGVAEGSQLSYWVGAESDDCIKYDGTTAQNWWLRSPTPADAYHVRVVYASGVLYSIYAGGANGVVPACCMLGVEESAPTQTITVPCDLYEGDVWYPMTGTVVSKYASQTYTGEENITAQFQRDGETQAGYRLPTEYRVMSESYIMRENLINVRSNRLPFCSFAGYYVMGKNGKVSSHDSVAVDNVYSRLPYDGVESVKEWLQNLYQLNTPLIVVYPLATPIIKQYDPQPIFAPTGTVHVTQKPIDLSAKPSATMLVRR